MRITDWKHAKYACPKCENPEIDVLVWLNLGVDSDYADHDLEGEAYCPACDHKGHVDTFTAEDK